MLTRYTPIHFILLLLLSLPAAMPCQAEPGHFAVAVSPAPVLNTSDFRDIFGGKDGRSLKTDKCRQIREVEFIAMPGTSFVIEDTLKLRNEIIYKVSTNDYLYPAKNGYFIDSRFVRLVKEKPPERKRSLPSEDEIISRLRSAEGTRYVWGGNIRAGVLELPTFYPPASKTPLSQELQDLWKLAGLDCSGLLYEATNGFTPRNTSSLVRYGNPVLVAGLSAEAIAALLKPLDLIVWQGHVLIAIDHGEVIESRLECGNTRNGVIISSLTKRLKELMRQREPQNELSNVQGNMKKGFVIRRWFDTLSVEIN